MENELDVLISLDRKKEKERNLHSCPLCPIHQNTWQHISPCLSVYKENIKKLRHLYVISSFSHISMTNHQVLLLIASELTVCIIDAALHLWGLLSLRTMASFHDDPRSISRTTAETWITMTDDLALWRGCQDDESNPQMRWLPPVCRSKCCRWHQHIMCL